jgi:4-amino-4-deoxy-L-arabinose transferase-like glycosyltransferase
MFIKKILPPTFDSFVTLALISVLIFYNVYASFHFLPITEGWFSGYAHLVLEGKVPYRDFYLYLTPLYVWIISVVTYLFGTSFFSLRIFGVVIVCLIGLTLFKILKKQFSSSASFTGVVIAIFYYQSGNAHIGYDFIQVLTLFALLSAAFLIQANTQLEIKSFNSDSGINTKFFLIPFFAQRRSENVFRAFKAGRVHIFERQI